MAMPSGEPAAAAALGDALAKLAVGTGRVGGRAALQPTFQYVPESIQQVCRMQELQERVAELEQALRREQDRSKLLESDLSRLRQQHQWSMSGSSGGSTPRRTSPCRLSSLDTAGSTGLDLAAAAHDAVAAGAAAAAADGGAAGAAAGAGGYGCGIAAGDTVVISRQALELLYLKERAMDAAKEGIVIADCSQPDMPLIYANEGFTRMTGYDRSDVLGRNCRFLQHPPEGTSSHDATANDAAVQELREAITAGMPCVVQLMNYKRNGDPFVNYLSLNPVYDAAGKLTHYVGVQSDITELVNHRQAELAAKHAALQAAAATEAKSQFLARMSHEIRTPLNGMIAVGQLLADTPLSPAQWDLVNTIRCSGEALLTLITDILDFSRIEANKMVLSSAEFRLQTVIEAAMEIAGLHAAQKRLQVAYNMAQSVPSIVIGDAQRLQQILLNILNNAVKFTEIGEILLEVWAEEVEEEPPPAAAPDQQQQQQGAAEQQQGQQQQQREAAGPLVHSARAGAGRPLLLQFSVRDTGIGIGAENIGRLFQSFSQVDASPTRRHGGSGLGLAICQRLCEAMGGRMWAESDGAGKGSLFRWCIRTRQPEGRAGAASGRSSLEQSFSSRSSLDHNGSTRSSIDTPRGPLALSPAPSLGFPLPAALQPSPQPQPVLRLLHGRRVLLVEPCPMVRQVLMLALQRWGCAVCAVGSEAEGVACLRMAGGSGGSGPAGLCSPPQPTSPDAQQQQQQAAAASIAAATAAKPPEPRRLQGRHSRRHMLLEQAQVTEADFKAPGPYDLVIMDMSLHNLLQALMLHAHATEAQRVVFMGWPGQNEPDGDGGDSSLNGGDGGSMHSSVQGSLASVPPPTYSNMSMGGLPDVRGSVAAQPPRMLQERLSQWHAPGQRQLGYVVVTRPVRQGRLRLALEEVLSMQLEEPAATAARHAAEAAAATAAAAAAALARPAGTSGAGGTAVGSAEGGSASTAGGAAQLPPLPGTPLDPAALLGLGMGSDGSEETSSLGSRASSCSNLRCAGATLVRATASSSHLDAAAAASTVPLRLLLAEDNAINMKVALGILKRMGCTNIVTAEDGEAALEALHAAGGPDAFDVILMDLHMPKKGGMEAVRDIRRTWPRYKTKIIAVTADAFEDTRDNCIANGFDGWLAKPFRVEEFARVMAVCRSGGTLTPKRP